MPSGRTHDAITFFLAAPTAGVAYAVAGELSTALFVAASFLFGGLVFGPDLDTVSRQDSRWSAFRVIWWPYRSFFKHRSRFSHGLIFGALIRVVYFMGVLTMIGILTAAAVATYTGGHLPNMADIVAVWRPVGEVARRAFGENFAGLFFLGIWLGAASHTFTDMAGSFIKTGKAARSL